MQMWFVRPKTYTKPTKQYDKIIQNQAIEHKLLLSLQQYQAKEEKPFLHISRTNLSAILTKRIKMEFILTIFI